MSAEPAPRQPSGSGKVLAHPGTSDGSTPAKVARITRPQAGLGVGPPPARSGSGKLIPWAVALMAALLTAAIVLTAHQQLKSDRNAALESSIRDVENLARALEEHVVHTFMNADELAWSIKQQVEKRGVPDDLKAFMADRALPGTPFLLALIADEHGDSVRHTLSNKPLSIASRVHFKANVEVDPGRLVIGEPIVGRMTGKWSVHVARRINKPDGSFGGVVVIAIEQDYFARVYGQVRLGKAGFVMLIGDDGIVRARHGGESSTNEQVVDSSDLLRRIQPQPVGTYVAMPERGDAARVVSYRALKQYPLIVAVGMGMEDALDQFVEHRRDYITGSAIIIALVWASFGLLGWLIVRERRAALLLREANERAESANRVKSEFLANMTHELRTPLNGIIGFADCLQEELADESQRECARIIYASGCTLLGMVNSVLDIAKIEAGRMELHVSRESVRLLIEEVVAVHRPVVEGKGLRLELDLALDLPDTFPCDRAKLVRVLNNLLHNAIKFTDEGYVRVTARMDAGTLVLCVNDTGCGISPEMHQAIFERFTQSEESGTGLRGGTGLGLALARDLVRLMGGRIEVDSRPGQGAEFRVFIPAALGEAT